MAVNQKKNTAERLACLLGLLEREGSMAIKEIASRQQISTATATADVSALLAAGLVAQGREFVCGTGCDRKIRLRDDWHVSVFRVCAQGIRALSYCPATGICTRQSVSLCDAIPFAESLSAAWHRVLATESARALGVVLEDGEDVPDAIARELAALPTESESILLDEEILHTYPTESVLYVRYGNTPVMRLFSDGTPISAFRPNDTLRTSWPTGANERMAQMSEQIARVLSLVRLDCVLLETDGADVAAVTKGLRETLSDGGVTCPPIVASDGLSLCERRMLARLSRNVAEQAMEASKKRKSPDSL